MSKLKLKKSKTLKTPSRKATQRQKVRRAIKRTSKAIGTAVGAASYAVGQTATGGEWGDYLDRRLDKMVEKELKTKGISKKRP